MPKLSVLIQSFCLDTSSFSCHLLVQPTSCFPDCRPCLLVLTGVISSVWTHHPTKAACHFTKQTWSCLCIHLLAFYCSRIKIHIFLPGSCGSLCSGHLGMSVMSGMADTPSVLWAGLSLVLCYLLVFLFAWVAPPFSLCVSLAVTFQFFLASLYQVGPLLLPCTVTVPSPAIAIHTQHQGMPGGCLLWSLRLHVWGAPPPDMSTALFSVPSTSLVMKQLYHKC